MPDKALHWSKNKKSFGYNIPDDLKSDSLANVQQELAQAGLEVCRGETQVIVSRQENDGLAHGMIVKFPNGNIQVYSSKTQKRSSDGGKTWRKVKSEFRGYACQLSDGQIIQFTKVGDRFPDEKNEQGLVKTSAILVRSRDNGLTETEESIDIYLPTKLKWFTLNHARILQLADGSLISAAYGRHEDDPEVTFETWVTKDGVVHPFGFRKYRIIVTRSTDQGKTWHYLSTVAFDLTRHTRTRIAGFCESDMVALPDGQILCFMRTVCGGGIRPLHMSMSNDGGRTWSNADPVADRGICPYACLMSNGVLAVSYGRPGNWLMFSVDGGQSWIGHFQWYTGPKAWDCWNQFYIEEVAPDTLLAVYGRTDPDNPKRGEIAGTFFTVRSTK